MSLTEELVFEEFYISCNPPLLPVGVNEVIESIKAEHQDKVLEILYEPEAPWFKLITSNANRVEVTQSIQEQLVQMGQQDAFELDTVIESDKTGSEQVKKSDIIVAEGSQRMVPWMAYDNDQSAAIDSFDEFRFPESMRSTQHRAIWRCPTEDFEETLHAAAQTWVASEVPLALDDMGDHCTCEVSHNLQKTVLYIGSNASMEAVQRTIKKLDGIVSVMNLASTLSQVHFVEVEGESEVKLGYRWLSHLGLDKTTYHFNLSSTGPLRGTALRTAVETVRGENRWRLDKTSYPMRGYQKPDMSKSFTIFADYGYHEKKAHTEFANGSLNTKPALCVIESLDLNRATAVSRAVSRTSTSTAAIQVEKWVEGVKRASIHPVLSEEPQLSDLQIPNATGVLPPALHNSPPFGSSKAPEQLPEDLIELESNSSQPKTPIRKTSTKCLLEAESPERKAVLLGYETLTPRNHTLVTAKGDAQASGVQCNLMDSVEQIPQNLNFEPLEFSRHNSVSSSRRPVDLALANSLVLFGLEEDRPKELHRTMDQRAGRKRESPSKNCIQKGPPEGFWNQGTSNAATPQPGGKTSMGQAWSDVVRGRAAAQSVERYKSLKVEKASTVKQVGSVHPLPTLANTSGMGRAQVKDNIDPGGSSSRLLESISSRMKDMAGILRVVPGRVKLEMKFGRIWFNDVSEADIHSDDSFQLWDVTDIQDYLNDKTLHDSCHGTVFQSILTSCGEDADKLSQIRAPGEPRWEVLDAKVNYNFTCYMEGPRGTARFKVVVNAETFEHVCLGLDEELSNIYVHCPQYAWDMKVCAIRARSTGFPEEYEEFAKHLVASLEVMTKETGDITIEVEQPKGRGIVIENVEVRHTARYKSEASNSGLLTITMTRPMATDVDYRKDPSVFRCSSYFAKTHGKPTPGDYNSINKPGEWFEMSLSSRRVEELFQENAGMDFGQVAGWTAEALDNEGVFRDICRPAFSMVSMMDGIGLANDNGLAVMVGGAHLRGSSTKGNGQRKYEYW